MSSNHPIYVAAEDRLDKMRMAVRRATSRSQFEDASQDLRKLVEDISDDIVTVKNMPVTDAGEERGERKIYASYSAQSNDTRITSPDIFTVSRGRKDPDQGRRGSVVKNPRGSNPNMNRSDKGVANKVLAAKLEKLKDMAYDLLFDVDETIARMKRRGE